MRPVHYIIQISANCLCNPFGTGLLCFRLLDSQIARGFKSNQLAIWNRSDSNHWDSSCDFYPRVHRFRGDFSCDVAAAIWNRCDSEMRFGHLSFGSCYPSSIGDILALWPNLWEPDIDPAMEQNLLSDAMSLWRQSRESHRPWPPYFCEKHCGTPPISITMLWKSVPS